MPVRVCVVVKGRDGKVIAGLRRQNFRLFDDGRPQRITNFAENLVIPPPSSRATLTTPRYIALYFDDLHLDFAGVVRATDGAFGYFSKHLGPWDRVGIFTASGQNTLDFTHDLAKLHQTLLAIRPHPASDPGCPKLSDYEAYLLLYTRDPIVHEVALEEAQSCDGSERVGGRVPLTTLRRARQLVDTQAHRTLAADEPRASQVIEGLDQLVTRFSRLPDPRSIEFISPGFISAKFGHRIDEISERALKLNIIINSIDMSSQISEPTFNPAGLSSSARHRMALAKAKYGIQVDGASMAADVLMAFPGTTGGTFVPNTYGAESAFPMAVPLPSSYYVLTFYPAYLRHDGSYHLIHVNLVKHSALFLQARGGYFAPGNPELRRRFSRQHHPSRSTRR